MKLSVVILNYNVRYFLEQCILSVKAAIKDIDAEIIVVDNNSADDSCEMILRNYPEIRLFQNEKNVGFSKANNQGVALAKGEYVCILNPDTLVGEDVFLKTLQFADENPDLGALGVKLIDGTGNFLPESKRNVPTPRVSLQKIFQKKTDNYYAVHIAEDEVAPVEILVGAFMLLKKNRYLEVGGFDEDYFMYGEDIDFSYKLTKAGYKNYYFGKTSVLHYKGESTAKDAEYLRRFYNAMRIFYKKHFSSNLFTDAFIMAGTKLAELKGFSKIKKQQKTSIEVENYLLIGDHSALKSDLEEKLGKKFQLVPFSVLSEEEIEKTYVVFDNENIQFSEIIKMFQRMKGKGNIFRIKPDECDFLIGSDKSDSKGEVSIL
ncbi:MAG TPA: glycosyltransferase family 2 protein [Salinimicrobium sp.]|nr:glycosyltransferase family 2 protein [Salinimicrobium sp.]